MRISVAISTRDRGRRLGRTLEALSRLEVPPGVEWELIVVDNGSTDSTAETVRAFRARLPLRALREERPGLSRARNLALARARGKVVAFTDDDCLVAPDWLSHIADAFEREPELAGIGGRVELDDTRDLPVTVRLGRERAPLTSTGQLYGLIAGCNMAFRRETFERVGVFDVRLGPGASGVASDDVDFLYRCMKAGLRIEYLPDVVVLHAHGRRTRSEVDALERGYRISRGAFYCKHILRGDREILRRSWWEISGYLEGLAGAARRGRSVRPFAAPLGQVCLGAVRRLTLRGTR